MNKIASIFVLSLAICGCDINGDKSNSSEAAKDAAQPSFGNQPLNNSWPPATQNVQLGNNLVASNYYIVFDGSGSMEDTACGGGGGKIEVAKKALKHFIGAVPDGANIGLFVFDQGGVREVAALGTARETIIQKVNDVRASGSTPLGESVLVGMRALTAQAQKQMGYGEYDLVVITDGQADNEASLETATTNVLMNTPIIIHTIGFCIGDGHSLNRKGKTLYYAANSEAELNLGLQQVLAEAPEYVPTTFNGSTER